MPDPLVDPQQLSATATDRAKAAYNVTYDVIQAKSNDPRLASTHAARAVSAHIASGGIFKTVVDAGFTLASDILAEFFNAISTFRKEETHTFDATIVAVLGEFLGVDFKPEQLRSSVGGDAALQKANAIGKLLLARLEQEFAPEGKVTLDSGELGAATFTGYGVNFGIQNALISLIGSIIPETRLEDLRELGVEIAQNIGLGRLVRQALRPLVQHTISTPYDRKLAKKYQQNLLGLGELVKAWLAQRIPQATTFEWMQEHGISDAQINELIAQHKPRLKAEEWDLLGAIGADRGDINNLQDAAEGTDAAILANRLRALQYRRLHAARERVLNTVLTQVAGGFLSPTDLQSAMDSLAIPADEQLLWNKAAGYLFERTRKRLSQGEMLFLYEAAQITLAEVEAWAKAEGYSDTDVARLSTYFSLKAAEATHKGSGGNGAKASAIHLEHVAFITDTIKAGWERAPSQAELTYWVPLLDSGARTKSDVKAELKLIDKPGDLIPG